MSKAKQLLQEMPINTGEYGDFIDPSHKRRIAGHQAAGLPRGHAEVLASSAYQNAVRKLARYTGITPRGRGDLMQVTGMMMQALQQVSQIERGHEQELEQAAVNLVLSLPEFKSAADAVQAGQVRVRAQLTPNIDLQAAQLDAEDTTEREDLKIAQVAQELDLEVQKRRMINMMIQGNAMNKLDAYHMATEQLNAIDPRLLNLYGVLTSTGEFAYWIFPEDMQKQAMDQRTGAGGAAHVNSAHLRQTADDGVPEIVAQGVTFPMLVHELVKALMEYISYDEDMDAETRAHVSGQADTLDNELLDSKIGPAAWRAVTSQINDQELIPYVYDHLVRLPATQFSQTMQTLLQGGPRAKALIDELVQQIKTDLEGQNESVPDVIVRNMLD